MESEEGFTVPLHGKDDVHGGHCLSLSVSSVHSGVSEEFLHKLHDDLSGVWVDEARNSLDTSSSGKSSNASFGDAFDHGLCGTSSEFSSSGGVSRSFS